MIIHSILFVSRTYQGSFSENGSQRKFPRLVSATTDLSVATSTEEVQSIVLSIKLLKSLPMSPLCSYPQECNTRNKTHDCFFQKCFSRRKMLAKNLLKDVKQVIVKVKNWWLVSTIQRCPRKVAYDSKVGIFGHPGRN